MEINNIYGSLLIISNLIELLYIYEILYFIYFNDNKYYGFLAIKHNYKFFYCINNNLIIKLIIFILVPIIFKYIYKLFYYFFKKHIFILYFINFIIFFGIYDSINIFIFYSDFIKIHVTSKPNKTIYGN